MKTKDVMSRKLFFCTPTDSCQHVAELMKKHQIGSLPVVESAENKRLVGIVTDRDLTMRLIAEGLAPTTPVSVTMSSKPITCTAEDSLEECETRMQKHKVRRIPILDNKGMCIGMIAQADIALRDDARHLQRTMTAISTPAVQAAA